MSQTPDIAKMEQMAAQGNRVAQYNLGVWKLGRSAGGQITEEARRLLLESAKQGFAPAQVALGSIYLKLRGQEYNPGRAAYWFEEASRQGSADAQYRLAELRAISDEFDAGYQLTRQGLGQAAEQNHTSALCQLAYCQDHGIGGDREPNEATRSWMRAADLGAPRAASNLGWRYQHGYTVKHDPVRALAWYLRAEAADYPGSGAAVAALAEGLSEQEFDFARELAAGVIDHDDPVATNKSVLDFEVVSLSTAPRISRIKSFFTIDECDHLVRIARPFMQPSTVISVSGSAEQDDDRSSEESPIWDQICDLVVHRLEERMHQLTNTPILHGEPIMVLHYGKGMEYRPHEDYFDPDAEHMKEQLSRGGQRLATIITYLSNVTDGGATEFPIADISVAPIKGDAVMFFNTLENGLPDPLTKHAGTAVRSGDKWLATRWIREWNWREPREYIKPDDA